uniref:DUF4371 domain-containing protein n=1 Tax=Lactuca sativa TaxID=4236 RepID=A0A9R1XHE3_LACSA|nr:hypothetical protein LSAT_V11C500239980 [Lactuca sativa]
MKTIDSFFKRKVDNEEIHDENIEIKRHKASTSEPQPQEHENQQETDIFEATQANPNEVGLKQLERDPAKRKQMWDYLVQRNILVMKQNEAQILKIHLRLKTLINKVRWFTFQACALRGHDESPSSKNHGNFLQLLNLLASYNDEVANKAPYNLKYTSGEIQKEIISIIANKFRKHIRSEVGDSYFCVMVDESQDGSKKEQMVIILRFVDVEGIMRERLQIALVAASREIIPVHQFFTNLFFLINIICTSIKRHDGLQKAKETEIEQLLELGEIESVGTLRRAGETRWSSHFRYVCSFLNIFDCTRVVLQGVIDDVSATYSQLMGKTDVFSQALQTKSQDILNAIELVSATKEGLNEFKNMGWDSLLA